MGIYQENIFPVLNQLLSRPLSPYRKELLKNAVGNVLEIGFGTGLSLADYPQSVAKIVGMEPSLGMIKKAKNSLQSRSIELIVGSAESIPFENESFDSTVSLLTLCSVTDLELAVSELSRVLKLGGTLFFMEHVAQPKGLTKKLQNLLDPLWSQIACGCHINRNTIDVLREQGFEIGKLESIGWNRFPNISSPIYFGEARKARRALKRTFSDHAGESPTSSGCA